MAIWWGRPKTLRLLSLDCRSIPIGSSDGALRCLPQSEWQRLRAGCAGGAPGRAETRVVVPLMLIASAPKIAKRLNPGFEIGAALHVMVTQFMAAVRCAALRNPVMRLAGHDIEIGSTLDMAFIEF